jgi:hypothetical protein
VKEYYFLLSPVGEICVSVLDEFSFGVSDLEEESSELESMETNK